MADKLTDLLVDALTRAAAEPAGLPLFATKTDSGLFPSTAAARPAAKKAIDDGLLRVARPDPKGKAGRELCAATDAGLRYLAEQADPRQVLNDCVRVLEEREGQVAALVAAARNMADGLAGLRAAVSAVLPRTGGAGRTGHAPGHAHTNGAGPPAWEGGSSMSVATLDRPTRASAPPADDDLPDAVLARLSDWAASAAVGQDCPLPELYRSLSTREVPPTIGAFHDCLRALHAAGQLYLHPWTGPLYTLPEPAYALLVGHNVAYYASAR